MGTTSGRDDEAELVSIVTDAGAESCPGDGPHPVQQPRALSNVETTWIRNDGATTNDDGNRFFRAVVDRRGAYAGCARWRQRVLNHVASCAICITHIRRSTRLRDWSRICIQSGAVGDEERIDGFLESFGNNRQSLGARCKRRG